MKTAASMFPACKRAAQQRRRAGFSLIEISLVISLMLGLAAIVGFNIAAMQAWQAGKTASLNLQAVYAAQRSFMADHPSADIATVPKEQLQGYLPDGWSTLPVFVSLDYDALELDHTSMPPRLFLSGTLYDPSDNTSDGLWDVGQ